VFTFTVTNQSKTDFSGLEVQNTVPAYVESFEGGADAPPGYICGDGDFGEECEPGDTMTWTLGMLPAGQSRSVTFAVQVKSGTDGPPEGETISTDGTASADGTGGASASAGVVARSTPRLSLQMVAESAPTLPGQNMTYELKFGNSSDADLSGVLLQAQIPAGATFVSADGSGIASDGSVQWTIGELEAGKIGRRMFTVMVSENLDEETILSSAEISDVSGENPAQADEAVPVSDSAPLALEATASSDPTQPGGQINFTLTVTNQSSSDLSGLQIQNTVPAYVESFDGGPDAPGYFCGDGDFGEECEPGNTMTWNLGELPAGQSQTEVFSVQVSTDSNQPPENAVLRTRSVVTADDIGGVAAGAGVLSSTASYEINETVDGRFQTSLNEEEGTYAVTVQLKADPGETDIGTSTVRFNYNQFGLEYSSVSFANYDGSQPSFTGGTVTYSSNVTQPDPGEIALNITKESSTDGNGQALMNEWTEVATLTFDILDPDATSSLDWPMQDIHNRLGEPDGQYERGTFQEEDQALPVELASFQARVDGRVTVLEWQTASEDNNAGFEVQRRATENAGTWEEIGFVDSKAEGGTTNEPRSYRFEDEDLSFAADRLEYRLRQVDLDGTTEVTEPVEIERTVYRLELRQTFPNPARRQATVQFAVPERQEVSLRLYDTLGRQVRTLTEGNAEGRQEMQVDLSGLSSGTYLLRLDAEGQTETQQVTVVR
jgi:uncharacterized repeat protein (TIGR01451 family)